MSNLVDTTNRDTDRGARCTECGELFVDKANLDSHMRRHTGERPFSCKYCEMSFAFRAILSKLNMYSIYNGLSANITAA